MSENAAFGRYLAFINCQLKPSSNPIALSTEHKPRWRGITISRQAGTGGHLIAELVAGHLQTHRTDGEATWMVFDRNLLEKVLEHHQLPARLAKYMPEDRVSGVHDTLDELFGLHPPTWKLVEKANDTILRLAELGNVILLGRGGNIITSKLDYMFHVRLVGDKAARIEFVQADRKLDKKAATELVEQEDEGRRRYIKHYFHRDIDDPSLYHLTINTTQIGHVTAAGIIAESVLRVPEVAHAAHAALARHSLAVA
jgi:cytidylate kinase